MISTLQTIVAGDPLIDVNDNIDPVTYTYNGVSKNIILNLSFGSIVLTPPLVYDVGTLDVRPVPLTAWALSPSSDARSGRIEQKKAQRILEFALGRLALDYKESRTKPLVVNLVLGVPITDMHQDSKTIQTLKDLMIGRHYIQVDGEELVVEIPSEDYILVVPQYMGTAFELAYDDAMHPVDAYANGRMGILDIGGGTILIQYF